MIFRKKLEQIVKQNNSLLCVGLDSEFSRIPKHLMAGDDPQFEFNKAIIDATQDLVCAYKPNMAFYEAEGIKGYTSLKKTLDYIPSEIPVILDAKRGDIGNTSRLYAKAYFEKLKVDAVTLHGYMGEDTVSPFLEFSEKAIFLMVKNSNPSAAEFQDIVAQDGKMLSDKMAELVSKWDLKYPGLVGAVVGATYPDDISRIRKILPGTIFLIPGLGKQGGDAEKTVRNGLDAHGAGIIVSSSRGIIFASTGEDFAQKAREQAQKIRDEINRYRY